jgi:hypothetical protein
MAEAKLLVNSFADDRLTGYGRQPEPAGYRRRATGYRRQPEPETASLMLIR